MANLIRLVTKYAALAQRRKVIGLLQKNYLTTSLILSLLSLNPVMAYGSGNTIYVKREHGSKPSLLDRKFVFRQVATNSVPQTTSTNLSAMSKQISLNTTTVNHAQESTPKAWTTKGTRTTQPVKDPGSNNWNDFAVETELDESHEVSAKLISN